MTQADIELQLAVDNCATLPDAESIQTWVEHALVTDNDIEMTVRIVGTEESQSLNAQYRGKDKPTNVLSFPFEAPAQIELNLLGDLVICAPVVEQEALEQNKPLRAHWAHMVVHGTLHLQGYDHIKDTEAEQMENLEIRILQQLGFDNPYEL